MGKRNKRKKSFFFPNSFENGNSLPNIPVATPISVPIATPVSQTNVDSINPAVKTAEPEKPKQQRKEYGSRFSYGVRACAERSDPKELIFSAAAWLKLQYLCHLGNTEIGGYAISTSEAPLYIKEFHIIKQYVSSVTVSFDDMGLAQFADKQLDRGYEPKNYFRIWCHTHPGDCPLPSETDEETFHRIFENCDWGLMFILSRTGKTYARLRYFNGPKFSRELPVNVDWSDTDWVHEDTSDWEIEYHENVHLDERNYGGYSQEYYYPSGGVNFFPSGIKLPSSFPATPATPAAPALPATPATPATPTSPAEPAWFTRLQPEQVQKPNQVRSDPVQAAIKMFNEYQAIFTAPELKRSEIRELIQAAAEAKLDVDSLWPELAACIRQEAIDAEQLWSKMEEIEAEDPDLADHMQREALAAEQLCEQMEDITGESRSIAEELNRHIAIAETVHDHLTKPD